MNALAIELQTYFTVFAHAQRDLAANTISAYRDTWRMLIKYLADTTRTKAEHIDFNNVDAEHVSAFLDYLENERGNTVSTRNSRLCAIRAVLSHAVANYPEHAATITRVLAMSPKRHPVPMLEFLTNAEADALIAAPDRTRWTGRRSTLPRRARAPARDPPHQSSNKLPERRRQARHPPHPAPHRGDEPARPRRRRRRHRSVARTPTNPIRRRLPTRRHEHQANRDRPHPAPEHKTRHIPPRTRHPRLASNPMNMPTFQTVTAPLTCTTTQNIGITERSA
jgi:hypothetical protein